MGLFFFRSGVIPLSLAQACTGSGISSTGTFFSTEISSNLTHSKLIGSPGVEKVDYVGMTKAGDEVSPRCQAGRCSPMSCGSCSCPSWWTHWG